VAQSNLLKGLRKFILKLVSVWRTYQYRNAGVPFRQAEYFHHLLKFDEALNNYGLTSFLMDGTLIGAVRQGAFAGRPLDLDFAILTEQSFDFEKFQKYLLSKKFSVWPGYEDLKFRKRFQFEYRVLFGLIKIHSGNISLVTFSKDENGDWSNPIEEISYKSKLPFGAIRSIDSIGAENLSHLRKVKVFGRVFNAPQNAEELIAKQYGDDWMTPKSRQFAWFPQEERKEI
jgi:phosphorylcholine metabolism protein LicD